MPEINKGIVLLLELIIAVGAILFLAGLYIEIFRWTAPISSQFIFLLGAVIVLLCGFGMALYYTRDDTPANRIRSNTY